MTKNINKKISESRALKLGKLYNINFNVVHFDEWLTGLNIETEHFWTIKALLKKLDKNTFYHSIANIAMDHLKEDSRYYYFLKKQEQRREKYYENHHRKSIFN